MLAQHFSCLVLGNVGICVGRYIPENNVHNYTFSLVRNSFAFLFSSLSQHSLLAGQFSFSEHLLPADFNSRSRYVLWGQRHVLVGLQNVPGQKPNMEFSSIKKLIKSLPLSKHTTASCLKHSGTYHVWPSVALSSKILGLALHSVEPVHTSKVRPAKSSDLHSGGTYLEFQSVLVCPSRGFSWFSLVPLKAI
jgi:hypothetical protein